MIVSLTLFTNSEQAGLFSAIATAFIIESYKTLKQDPSDLSVVLLSQILSQLEHSANASLPTQLPHDSTLSGLLVTSSNLRVNAFWFVSLILSLTTVLVGTVALQWLREHQRPTDDLSPQLAYSLLRMQTEAMERWHVPDIFTALPLLFQLGLVLFLTGIADFVWHLNRTVAAPVIIAVCGALFFLISTSLLPTLQVLTLFLHRRSKSMTPRAPCPYKSPQAWALHRLVSWTIHLVRGRPSVIRYQAYEVYEISKGTSAANPHSGAYIPLAVQTIFRQKPGDGWVDHGLSWLYQRDIDRISVEPAIKGFTELLGYLEAVPPPSYDAMNQLISTVKGSTLSEDEWIAADHCFEDLIQFSPLRYYETGPPYSWYLYCLVKNSGNAMDELEDASRTPRVTVVEEDLRHLFHALGLNETYYRNKYLGPRDSRHVKHRMETALRVLRRLHTHPDGGWDTQPPHFLISPVHLYFLILKTGIALETSESRIITHHSAADLICLEVQLNQIIDIFESFLQATVTSDRVADKFSATSLKIRDTGHFIQYIVDILHRNAVVPNGCTDAMTHLITNHLRTSMEATPVQPPTTKSTKSLELMFWAAAEFAQASLHMVDKVPDSLSNLLLTLKQCTDMVLWRGAVRVLAANSDIFWLSICDVARFRELEIPDSLDTSPPPTGDEIALGCAPRPLTFDEEKPKASIIDILPAILKRT